MSKMELLSHLHCRERYPLCAASKRCGSMRQPDTGPDAPERGSYGGLGAAAGTASRSLAPRAQDRGELPAERSTSARVMPSPLGASVPEWRIRCAFARRWQRTGGRRTICLRVDAPGRRAQVCAVLNRPHGIAKGYGADRLAEILGAFGIGSALVGIDGEMRAAGLRPPRPALDPRASECGRRDVRRLSSLGRGPGPASVAHDEPSPRHAPYGSTRLGHRRRENLRRGGCLGDR